MKAFFRDKWPGDFPFTTSYGEKFGPIKVPFDTGEGNFWKFK